MLLSNDFFDNHSMLGAMFDLDRDGSLDLGEAMFMGAMGAAIIDEEEHASKKTECESGVWDDDLTGKRKMISGRLELGKTTGLPGA